MESPINQIVIYPGILVKTFLFYVYSLTSISNEIGAKNIRKNLRSCAGSRNYDKQNTEKVLQLKDVFLVYL